MQFKIGTRAYHVQLRRNLTHEGSPLDGLCDSTTKTIWLDADLAEDSMLSTLRHEVYHAWEFETGAALDEESRACLSSTVGDAFDYEFDAQGGAAALAELPVDGVRGERPKPKAEPEFKISDRAQCGTCGCEVMAGSIHTGEPRQLETVAMVVVDRGFCCPVCDVVQVWEEKATADGRPLGEYHRVRILRGAEAGQWLDSHRELLNRYNLR